MPRKTKTGSVTEPSVIKPMGRPTLFNQELADVICERLAVGSSLRTICEDAHMPNISTVLRWLNDQNHIEFCAQYKSSRDAQYDYYAEQIIDIADDGRNDTYLDDEGRSRTDQDVIARSRLRVDARKWYVSKLAHKKYGEKLDVTAATTSINTNVNVGTYDTSKLSMDELAVVIANLTKALR